MDLHATTFNANESSLNPFFSIKNKCGKLSAGTSGLAAGKNHQLFLATAVILVAKCNVTQISKKYAHKNATRIWNLTRICSGL
jgi:hypothetical protein